MNRNGIASSIVLGLVVALTAGMAGAQVVSEGQWINLFDGETLYGWTAFGDAEWEVKDGAIYARGGHSGFLASTCRFTDFELTARVKVEGAGSTVGLALRSGLEGHASCNGGATIVLRAGDSKDWQEVKVRAVGGQVSATVDGKAVEGLAPARSRGHILLQYHRYHGQRSVPKISIADVRLRPIGLRSVFNGENLDGWNVIPDHASVFSVQDGAINIKDGNGQIETAETFRDFILQLDIISNGEHLNSGVFYRGPVGVFWKGYESQVRNQWGKDDRTRPVDFGTGGVYGVCPARKVVSTDHEWFSKTVVCEGNHMAVWIDGYLVSDFYDTRPVADNGDGKNGFVPEAGTIHLQGHDPTTDLSFKNIHVQEYPPCDARCKDSATP